MAKPGSRAAKAISRGANNKADPSKVDFSEIREITNLITEASRIYQSAPDKLSSAMAAKAKFEEFSSRYPIALRKFRADSGLTPVTINGSRAKGLHAGYFQTRLRDGTLGYLQRRNDDCFQTAIASLLQIRPHQVPDLHLTRQFLDSMDPEEIARNANAVMTRWMNANGVTIVVHPTLPSSAKRWIGVVLGDGWGGDHCLLMSGRDCLFDGVNLLPPAIDGPASTCGYEDVDYAVTVDQR